MAIQPVESGGHRDNRIIPDVNRNVYGKDFARIFETSVERARTAAASQEKVAEAAEIMRLEMMKSAVSFSGNEPEPASAEIGSALKAFLTHCSKESQKTDTAGSAGSQTSGAEDDPVSERALSTAEAVTFAGGAVSPYDDIIRNAASRYGVQEGLIKAVIKMESGFNPRAVSRAGARGLMQLMPSTAAGLGVRDSFDPEQNIMAGTRFLRELLEKYGGDLDSALAAYNWGPGNVDRSRGAFLPRETKEYLVKVKKYYTQFAA